MYEFRCVQEGIFYYDPVLKTDMFAPNTLLFLIGYSRVFGDTHVSDKLYIPHVILDSNGNTVALPNYTFSLSARAYLTQFSSVEVLDTGDLFELYGLPLVLEQIGFFNFYKSSNGYNTSLNRVPHVPLFTRRSQDYKRIANILTNKSYWADGFPNKGIDELYSVYNPIDNRAESLDLYNSFGSLSYMDTVLYPSVLKPVGSYKDYCSWFIWDSLSFPQLYQFSAGVLYGMSQLSWGLLPYSKRPTEYDPYFKYLQLVDEAFFWFQNTAFDNTSSNDLINVDPSLFRINTIPLKGQRVGISMKVAPGTVILRTKYLWGFNLHLYFFRLVSEGEEYFVYNAATTPQNANKNISNTEYHQDILDSQCIKTVRFYTGGTLLITKDNFRLTRVPEYLSGYPSDIEIWVKSEDFTVPSDFYGVNFVAEPKDSWSLGSVIDLPEDLYSIDEEGNVEWNLEHPLYTILYGIEFTEVEQETETVIVYNSSMEQLELLHSLVTDLYYYNDEWITEEELNDYGWYVDRDLRVLRVLSSSIDQEIEYSMRFDLYSVDGGETWINSTEMRTWLDENEAEIVTGTITLYEGYTQLDLPVSAWFI